MLSFLARLSILVWIGAAGSALAGATVDSGVQKERAGQFSAALSDYRVACDQGSSSACHAGNHLQEHLLFEGDATFRRIANGESFHLPALLVRPARPWGVAAENTRIRREGT